MRRTRPSFCITLFFLSAFGAEARGGELHWQAEPPQAAKDSAAWTQLATDLQTAGLNYGAMAAAYHMIAFFPDVKTKESAYRTVLNVIDDGYPVPVRDIFISADIEPNTSLPENYAFANGYYLYKALLSRDKGSEQWSEHYLDRVDKEGFPKYLFLTAMDAYAKGDLESAESLLKKTLAKDLATQPAAFATKVARLLARIYFEQGRYDKASDIYRTFLLKLNPIVPGDWLEAAWSEYHQKHYEASLGLLYNLESKAGTGFVSLEKYSIRALIYRATCTVPSLKELTDGFDRTFKGTINGIKRGEPLSKYAVLRELEVPENEEYGRARKVLAGLTEESKRATAGLPSAEKPLVEYLYRSESELIRRRMLALTPDALNRAASQILSVSEQMRFLRFDIARAKYDPDKVFQDRSKRVPAEIVSGKGDDGAAVIRWQQNGDFWLDERNHFEGRLPNQCAD